MPLQIRRGTEAERQTLATPLVSGELLWITDDFRLYIGDGATLAKDLTPVTGYGDDNAKDAAASIFTAGTHSGISFSYDGSTAIDATVSYPALLENLSLNGFNITGSGNISIAGNVTVDGNLTGNFKGSIFADDSTLIIDGLTGTVNLAGTIRGNVLPDNNEVYDLGSPSLRFKDLYLSGSSLYLGDAQITATGSAVNLPLGSTINGVPIPNVESGVVSGSNYFINIVGDDSTLLIDSQNKVVTADEINAQLFSGFVLGDVKGSVFADDSGTLVNAVSNEIGNVNTTYNGISMDAGFNSFRLTSDLADIFQTYPFYDTGRVPAIVIRSSKGSDRGPSEPGDFIANFRTDGLTPLDYEGNGPNTLYRYCTGIISGWTAAADFNFNHPESALYLTTGPNDNDDLHIATFSKGNFTAPAITPGVYADSTARDAYLTSPTAGMMVFLTDTQQFQGYVSDTGLAGGGASNSTPGWINLN